MPPSLVNFQKPSTICVLYYDTAAYTFVQALTILFFVVVGVCRGAISLGLHEEALTCLMHCVGQLNGGLPCSVDPRVWLLHEVVQCLKDRKSVVQVRPFLLAYWDI